MASFRRDEVEEAFRNYWRTGAVGEDWEAWAELFTPDADYHERVLGSMKGREAIRNWIVPIMDQYGEIYTAYEWHMVDESGRAVVYMQNRRDHPSGTGVIDFPGITILQYAGDGLWSREEDYWAFKLSTEAVQEYRNACAKLDPEHPKKRTRREWGNGPAWTQGGPSYFDRGARG